MVVLFDLFPMTLPPIALRFLSASILAPLVLYVVYLGGAWFQGLIALCLSIALFEWVRLCLTGSIKLTVRMAWLISGTVYIIISSVCYILLYMENKLLVFFILILVWVADTGAFIIGKGFGGAKLAPRISPNKTWSGFAGALISSGIVANLFYPFFPDYGLAQLVLSGILIGAIAQLGDLLVSIAKRRFNVKDSGKLIPGHGGILDRIDGLLAVGLVTSIINGTLANGLNSWF